MRSRSADQALMPGLLYAIVGAIALVVVVALPSIKAKREEAFVED